MEFIRSNVVQIHKFTKKKNQSSCPEVEPIETFLTPTNKNVQNTTNIIENTGKIWPKQPKSSLC